jgi:hypothetical protein
MIIRVTVQIEDEEDENKTTVISSSFDTFQEIIDSNFIGKAKPFGNEKDDEECKKKKQIGFGIGKESK